MLQQWSSGCFLVRMVPESQSFENRWVNWIIALISRYTAVPFKVYIIYMCMSLCREILKVLKFEVEDLFNSDVMVVFSLN